MHTFLKSKPIRAIIATFVSVGLLLFLLSRIDIDLAIATFKRADLKGLFLLAVLSALVQLARGMRFAALLRQPATPIAIASVAIQALFLRITPFRLGELALPYLLKRHAGEDTARTLVLLLFVRIFDLFLVLLLAVIALVAYLEQWNFTAIMMILFITALLFTFRFSLSHSLRFASWLVGITNLTKIKTLTNLLDRTRATVTHSSKLTPGQLATVTVWSIVVIVAQTTLLAFFLVVFGVDLSLGQIAAGVSIGQIGAALPMPTVGSFGMLEAGWVAGFTLVGVNLNDAIVTGIAVQIITLAFSAIFAIPSWIYLASL